MRKTLNIARAAVLFSLAVAGLAHASGGSLDPAFGKGGIAISNFGSPILVADAILQSDGKIVAAISINESNFALARYLPNGALDGGFGTTGFAQTSFANFNTPTSMAIQPDGKIVVAGAATDDEQSFDFAVARFNSNGSLDNTFGAGGKATASVTGLLTGAVVVIQPDGKILVAGSALQFCRTCSPHLVLARFNPNGSLDATFANHGMVAENNAMNPTTVALNTAGGILVEGNSAIAEFSPGGSPSSQVTPAAIARSSNSGPAAFLPDGSFIVAEAVSDGSFRRRDTDTKVVRFTAIGNIDPAFNSPLLDFSGEGSNSGDASNAIAIQSNGQIVVVASHFSPGFTNVLFSLARLNPNGTLDPSFGSGGLVTTNVGGVEDVAAVLVQPDGKIVAIGTANNFSDVALVRYLGN